MTTKKFPRCRNTAYDHECHPAYAKRYGGYCLDCANAGLPDIVDAAVKAERERCAAIVERSQPWHNFGDIAAAIRSQP